MKAMQKAITLWLSLLLTLCPLLLASIQVTVDRDQVVDYNFIFRGDRTFIDFVDPVDEHSVRMQIPRFLAYFSQARIRDEMEHYFGHAGTWSERVVLEILHHAIKPERDLDMCGGASRWLNDSFHVCHWTGITCGPVEEVSTRPDPFIDSYLPPAHAVTKIDLSQSRLQGTLPSELIQLAHLQHLDLNANSLQGTIPSEYGSFLRLRHFDLGGNQLTGSLPSQLGKLSHTLEEVWLEKNRLSGSIHRSLTKLSHLTVFDLSDNELTGSLPAEIGHLTSLKRFFLEVNNLTGTLPPDIGLLKDLRYVDVGYNKFVGSLPSEIGLCSHLAHFSVVSNLFNNTIPLELFQLSNLEVLTLSENYFEGTLPASDDVISSQDMKKDDKEFGFKWSDFTKMAALAMDNNHLNGTLPPSLLHGLAPSLTSLEIGFNLFSGTLPTELGLLSRLERFMAPFCYFQGPIPNQILRMTSLNEVNLTANLLTGTVPKKLCESMGLVESTIIDTFGCDALLCRPGTFHPEGAASLLGGCQPCPMSNIAEAFTPPLSRVLGRSSCETRDYLYGDMDGDGEVSQAEVLRLLYYETMGPYWGTKFQSWCDLKVNECTLPGVACIDGKITKVDLTEANLCSDGESKEGTASPCIGLPAELMYLSDSLEVLSLPRRRFLRGTLPSELGALTKLQSLDLQGCELLSGTIPSELGNLSSLTFMDMSGCSLSGPIPSELFRLAKLEKLNLGANAFEGGLPSEIGNLESVKEIRITGAHLSGTLPPSLGDLPQLLNLQLYGNAFTGTIPEELGKSTTLQKIDVFNNKLTGHIPDSLGNARALQILMFKKNELTGTIPSSLGGLPYLVWLDASLNMLSGTIPSSLGTPQMMNDLRLYGNSLYGPIPQSLCTHEKVNGGRTAQYGCDAILCPRGAFSDQGMATAAGGCMKCPPGQTTIYFGSTECVELDQKDILLMLFDVLYGDNWPDEYKKTWKEENKMSVCQWAGATCDKEHKIIGLSIPENDYQETIQH